MKKDYKLLLIFGFSFFLILLYGLQVSFLDPSFLGINFFLVLIVYQVLKKNNNTAIFLAWVSGFLFDNARFSVFGLSSMVFIILVVLLITLRKSVFFPKKTAGIIFISVLAVIIWRSLSWLTANGLAFLNGISYDNFSSYFGFTTISEIIITVGLLLAIFKLTDTYIQNQINV